MLVFVCGCLIKCCSITWKWELWKPSHALCFIVRKVDQHSDKGFQKDLKVGLHLPHAFCHNNNMLIPP